MRFRFTQEFNVSVNDYWHLFLSEEFSKAIYQRLGLGRCLLERSDDGRTFTRAVRVTPHVALPPLVRAVLPDACYVQRDRLDRERGVMQVRIEPQLLKAASHCEMAYTVQPRGNGRCRQDFHGTLQIHVPVIGGMIEAYVREQLQDADRIGAQLVRSAERERAQAV